MCFAVYDGHGGDICARYVRTNLPKTLQACLLAMESIFLSACALRYTMTVSAGKIGTAVARGDLQR